MKHCLINDILNLVVPDDLIDAKLKGTPPTKSPKDFGDFILLDTDNEKPKPASAMKARKK
jgi:hypothetical protein